MKNIILLGAPGTGKGTQAANISKWYGIGHISTGDIFRSNIKAGTELGLTAKAYIDAGHLVPDEITIGMVKSKLSEPAYKEGFILDGFPRNIPQAEALDGYLLEAGGKRIHAVVSIFVPDETIVLRILGRRLCSNCGASYHTVYNPPAKEGLCDACGGKVVSRDDDSEATIRERLSVYYAQTEPIIERYRKLGIFTQITGHEIIDETSDEMHEALKKIFCE
ncbi:MAG: adenylate kinase [Oscillospiraceae bacterium]|nr:adenylate kinase [Oscillospiraceae bacterium]